MREMFSFTHSISFYLYNCSWTSTVTKLVLYPAEMIFCTCDEFSTIEFAASCFSTSFPRFLSLICCFTYKKLLRPYASMKAGKTAITLFFEPTQCFWFYAGNVRITESAVEVKPPCVECFKNSFSEFENLQLATAQSSVVSLDQCIIHVVHQGSLRFGCPCFSVSRRGCSKYTCQAHSSHAETTTNIIDWHRLKNKNRNFSESNLE